MEKDVKKFCFWMKWVLSILILSCFTFPEYPFAEENILYLEGKGGYPFFDKQGNLNVAYINLKGGITLATIHEEGYIQKISTQEINHVNNVHFIRAKRDRTGKIWLLWEERESGRSDVCIAQLKNQRLIQQKNISADQNGFNFSPSLDFSFLNDPWMAWVNYSQKKYTILIKNLGTGQIWKINSRSTASALSPQIIIDGTGKIWLFWIGQMRNLDEICYTYFDGERWAEPSSLNQNPDIPHIHPSVALDFNGFPHVVWSAYDGEDYELYYSHWNGNRWAQEKKVTNNRNIADTSPSLSLFMDTIPIVSWLRYSDGKREVVLTYRMGNRWITGTSISRNTDATFPPKIAYFKEKIGICWQEESMIRTALLNFHELYDIFPIKRINANLSRILTLDRDKYIGFGDSITYGIIAYEAAPEKGYVPRLEKLIDENIKESTVVNQGVGGEKTSEGLSRIHSVINEEQAKTIFLMEGTNDVKDENISMDTTAFNLKKMAERCLDFGMIVFLASIIPKDPWEGMIKERILELNEKIESVASALNISFVDQFEAFGGYHADHLYSDATHPNEDGYQLMAETWYAALVDSLPSIEVDTTSLFFEVPDEAPNPPPQIFNIRNSGAGRLRYQISTDKDWISISPTSGESKGEWDEIEVTVDTSNLSVGTHQGYVTINAEYAPNSPQVVSIVLTILGPVIELDKSSLLFEAVIAEPNPFPQTFQIRNSGEDTLVYQISDNKGWMTVSPTSGESSGEWDEIEVYIDISNLSRGSYQGQVSVSSENAMNSPQYITVKLAVFGPMIRLNKQSLFFEAMAGEANPPTQGFKIKNSGEETLNYQISTDKDWISVYPESGDSTGEWDFIAVSVNISDLREEYNQGHITITGENASNSPKTLDVWLHLQLPPLFPPLNFRAEKKKNRSLSQLEYINVLTWEANSKNKFIERYRIYLMEGENRILLAETDAQTFVYWHRKVEKDRTYTYGLTAVDKFDRESEAAVVEVR